MFWNRKPKKPVVTVKCVDAEVSTVDQRTVIRAHDRYEHNTPGQLVWENLSMFGLFVEFFPVSSEEVIILLLALPALAPADQPHKFQLEVTVLLPVVAGKTWSSRYMGVQHDYTNPILDSITFGNRVILLEERLNRDWGQNVTCFGDKNNDEGSNCRVYRSRRLRFCGDDIDAMFVEAKALLSPQFQTIKELLTAREGFSNEVREINDLRQTYTILT